MGLSSALNAASTGLRVTQASLDLLARNVANADTPGYTRKTLGTSENVVDVTSLGVRSTEVHRAVDAYLLTQLRGETSASASASIKYDFLAQIDQMFGAPGADYALDTLFGNFEQSLQDLIATPDSFAARDSVIAGARDLVQQIRSLGNQVQAMRQLAEDSLAQSVDEVNAALRELQGINEQIKTLGTTSAQEADLLDQRDRLLGVLSEQLDIRVTEQSNGMAFVSLSSGYPLLDGNVHELVFDQQGDLQPSSLYSTDDDLRGVGTIELQIGPNYKADLVASGQITSGRIGGLLELRDTILPQTQAQLDELAHGLALSFSNKQVTGMAAAAGSQTGFDLDTAGLQSGNSITLDYELTPSGATRTVTIIRVDDPSQLPLSNDVTANPNDTVLGVDFSGGLTAATAAIQAALGPGISVSAPGGTALRFLDDGGAGSTDITGLSANITATVTQDDGTQLPLFVDGGASPLAYTASLDGGSQKAGFASRITLNPEVAENTELLVRYESSPETPLGDTTRPLALLSALTDDGFDFSPQSGIGQSGSPYSGTIKSFAQRVISVQTGQVEPAERRKAALEISLGSLQDRVQENSGVDVDEELADLIALQNSFAANARIIQAVDEMMQLIIGIR